MFNQKSTVQLYDEYVMGTYARNNLVIAKAKGTWVKTEDGKMLLDFFPGWAVSGLGHCHKRVVRAIQAQAGRVMHVPNNYYHALQGRLAERIVLNAFNGKVFFCNSGAEANEAAYKLARAHGHPKRYEVITMQGSFHGRTLACIAATGQDKVKRCFDPIPAGFISVPFNDKDALVNAFSDKTAAVMLELIQGEGGIRIAEAAYVQFVRDFCTKNKILMMVDEVQTGMGRTGKMFAYQHYGIEPDVMTLAKSLGNGMPIGAMIAQQNIAGTLGPGMHGSTFGGNPLACAAGLAVFEAIEKERLLSQAETMGKYLRDELTRMKGRHPVIKQVRGVGLMLGMELIVNAPRAFDYCLANGLMVNCTQGTTLRIMPPLTVTKKEIDKAMEILDEAIKRC